MDSNGTPPALRLRPDASIQVGPRVTLEQAVEPLLAGDEIRSVGVSDAAGQMIGVVVPVDRYLSLVASQLTSRGDYIAYPSGRLEPAGLAESDVQQVDPRASWLPDVSRPEGPA
jgi:hypothetical protein